MCDRTVPHETKEEKEWDNLDLRGCDRIREAVHGIEILRAHAYPDARVEVAEFGRGSSLLVTLRSVEEMYLDGKMRRVLLASVGVRVAASQLESTVEHARECVESEEGIG